MIPRLEVQKILQQLIEDAGVQGIYFIINALKDFAHYRLVIGDRDPVWSALEAQLDGVFLQSPGGYYVQKRADGTFFRLPPDFDLSAKGVCEMGAINFSYLLPPYRCVSWGDYAALVREWEVPGESELTAEAMEKAQREIDRLSES